MTFVRSFLLLCSALRVQAAVPLPPYALEGTVSAARAFMEGVPLAAPTGLSRADYIPTISGIVQYFRAQQNASGAIIDAYAHEEIQYSTPCFALACSVAYAAGSDATLLPNCTAALSFAIHELATANCADGHCAFFGKPIVLAFRVLAPLVSDAVRAGWVAGLAAVDPWKAYGFPSGNWGLVAAVGQFLIATVVPNANTTWFEDMIAYQLSGQGVSSGSKSKWPDEAGVGNLVDAAGGALRRGLIPPPPPPSSAIKATATRPMACMRITAAARVAG